MTTCIDAVHDRAIMFDRNRADLTWERFQVQALQAFRHRNPSLARRSWAKALDIAERHFERGDPRIAASLTNHAFALMRQNQLHQANSFFQRALDAWEESWRWIPWMAPSAKPGEVQTPYDRQTQEAFYALVRRGRAITEALWREGRLPEVEGDSWPAVKPKSMNDIRRLFSAVFLMPTAEAGRGGVER